MLHTEVGDGLFEVISIVNGDLMFITEPPGRVRAIEAATGNVEWTFQRPVPERLPLCCGRVNRGVALVDDRVVFGTLDAHLIALDAKTGALRWDTTVAEPGEGFSITTAPLVVKGLVICPSQDLI